MGIVIFGHGTLDPIAAKDMEWVAIPTDTTLQFYAEAGQYLLTGPKTWAAFAAGLNAPWPAMDSTNVTYNLRLEALSAPEQREIDGLVDFPHSIYMIGRDVGSAQLCTGDSTTCPSDPRMIAGQVAGPQAHGCDGLLHQFAGKELHWVACTTIKGFDEDAMDAVTAARGDAPVDVWHGVDPDSFIEQARATKRDHPEWSEWYFTTLTDEQRDELLADPELKEWYEGHATT